MAYSNSELAQIWANREKQFGKGSNLFFEGTRIYSYGCHYLAGLLLPEKGVAIINKTKYSVSTSRHTRLIIEASRGYRQLYAYFPENHHSNTERTIRELHSLLGKYDRARTARKKLIVVNEIKALLLNLKKYNAAVEYTPTELQKKTILRIEELLESGPVQDLHRIEVERVLKLVDEFQGYKVDFFKSQYPALRISKDGNYIETSLGARLHIKEAKKGLQLLKSTPPEELPGKYIGEAKIISLSGDVIKIGCHEILLSDIEKIGDKIEKISYTPA